LTGAAWTLAAEHARAVHSNAPHSLRRSLPVLYGVLQGLSHQLHSLLRCTTFPPFNFQKFENNFNTGSVQQARSRTAENVQALLWESRSNALENSKFKKVRVGDTFLTCHCPAKRYMPKALSVSSFQWLSVSTIDCGLDCSHVKVLSSYELRVRNGLPKEQLIPKLVARNVKRHVNTN